MGQTLDSGRPNDKAAPFGHCVRDYIDVAAASNSMNIDPMTDALTGLSAGTELNLPRPIARGLRRLTCETSQRSRRGADGASRQRLGSVAGIAG
jgi:hypothetical protein